MLLLRPLGLWLVRHRCVVTALAEMRKLLAVTWNSITFHQRAPRFGVRRIYDPRLGSAADGWFLGAMVAVSPASPRSVLIGNKSESLIDIVGMRTPATSCALHSERCRRATFLGRLVAAVPTSPNHSKGPTGVS
jgi:hypothetical protein